MNKASVQVVRKWKQSPQQERLRETPAQFLWTTNPYLDVLNQQLQSAHSWFNQVESDFVQKSVLQRRKNTSWRWRIAIGVMLGLSGLTIAALIGQRNAQIGQTAAFRASAEANFRTNEQLNALVDSLRASKNIRQILFAQNDLQNQVGQTLRNMFYGVKESDRWEAPPGIVFSMFFAGDRQLRVITNANGKVEVWGEHGEYIAELQGQDGLYRDGISVSSDGGKIATATQDGTVRLWDLQGNKIGEFSAHEGAIERISFSPDGNTIATFEKDKALRLWDLQGTRINEFPFSPEQQVIGLKFNSSGNLLIAMLAGDSISAWELFGNEFQNLATFKNGYGNVQIEVSFSPDGKQAMIFHGNESENAALWNFSEQEPQNFSEDVNDRISQGSSFSADGSQYATTGVDGTVNLNWLNADRTSNFKLPQGRVEMSTFSPDGKQLVTLGDDSIIRVWDLEQRPLSS